MVFYLIQAYCWKTIAEGMGPRLGLLPALKYWFFSQVSKYVPGKVMLPIVRTRYCMDHGHRPEGVVLSIFLEVLIMMISSVLIALASTSTYIAEQAGRLTALYVPDRPPSGSSRSTRRCSRRF